MSFVGLTPAQKSRIPKSLRFRPGLLCKSKGILGSVGKICSQRRCTSTGRYRGSWHFNVRQKFNYRAPVLQMAVNAALLHWVEYGPCTSDELTLVFLHGFLGRFSDWSPLLRHLSYSLGISSPHSNSTIFSAYYASRPPIRIICVDLPGHGLSPLDPRYLSQDTEDENIQSGQALFDDTLRLVEETLKSRNVRRCVLIGYSMGGRVALALADRWLLRHNDKHSYSTAEHLYSKTTYSPPASHPSVPPLLSLSGLVVMSSHIGLEEQHERDARLHWDRDWAGRFARAGRARIELEGVLHDWYALPLFKSLWGGGGGGGVDDAEEEWGWEEMVRVDVPELIRERGRQDGAVLGRVMVGMSVATQKSYWDSVGTWAVPRLFMCGALDAKYVDMYERLAGTLTASSASSRSSSSSSIDSCSSRCSSSCSASTVVIPAAGHSIHIERPRRCAGEIVHFLTSNGLV